MISDTSSIIGIAVFGEMKRVSNGMEKSEKPKPVVPCKNAARNIIIEPRMRTFVSTYASLIRLYALIKPFVEES